jgi:anti-sigma regulatory factor (Ser/Thr protein kinase)
VLYWRRTFRGPPDQAHAVRKFVASLLPDRPRLDDVLLAVGEFVANALRHTKSGQSGVFAADVLHHAGRTTVSVTDEGGPAEPVAGDAAGLVECGRGLRAVSLLADSWGWHGNDGGRTVTAVFDGETA